MVEKKLALFMPMTFTKLLYHENNYQDAGVGVSSNRHI